MLRAALASLLALASVAHLVFQAAAVLLAAQAFAGGGTARVVAGGVRPGERRLGKESRSRWSPDQ